MRVTTRSGVSLVRTYPQQEPYSDLRGQWSNRGRWPVQWIGHPQIGETAVAVIAFRNKLTLDEPLTTVVHVTADERYELYIDGEWVARGSEVGAPKRWYYESYELTLPRGEHTIVALTWHLGHAGPSPCTHMSLRHGFLFAAQDPTIHPILSTGQGGWEAHIVSGYHFSWPYPTELPFTGARVRIKAEEMAPGILQGEGSPWVKAKTLSSAVSASQAEEQPDNVWLLSPATLPDRHTQKIRAGACRHVEKVDSEETERVAVKGANHLVSEASRWNEMISKDTPLSIAAHTRNRIIIDMQNYYCGWVEVSVSGGAQSLLRIGWAESLYDEVLENAGGYRVPRKGNRDAIEGKYFRGFADIFEPAGRDIVFRPLWWSAGRYLEIYVSTGENPLIINSLRVEETHYPYEWKDTLETSDSRLTQLVPILKRTLEMCSHETYQDCPHYEQLMYIADTRLEVLQTYVTTDDDRLPRKALEMFDLSRLPSGLTQSRYPTRVMQLIPTFSLWWIGMVHDYLMWRGDVAFVKERMVGVRGVLEAFRGFVNDQDLIQAPMGWNFIDWVPGWNRGVAADGETGVSGPVNLIAALIFKGAAQLEEAFGETLLAQRNREMADRFVRAVNSHFWSESRGMLSDDREHKHFSEHSQCLALLADALSGDRRERAIQGLLTAPDLYRTTIFFSHYLFETLRLLGRGDKLYGRMDLWFDLLSIGMKTTLETPEPSRSDCHGWGAHPLFHLYASFLGIRPSQPGFKAVRIQPLLGPLQYARGRIPHPNGSIEVDFRNQGRLTGSVVLPEGITGELIQGDRTIALSPGMNRLS